MFENHSEMLGRILTRGSTTETADRLGLILMIRQISGIEDNPFQAGPAFTIKLFFRRP